MTVPLAQQMVSSSEFSEWCIYTQLEPTLEERLDFHLTRMYQVFLASKGIKDETNALTPWDSRKRELREQKNGRQLPKAEVLEMKLKHAMGLMAKLQNK